MLFGHFLLLIETSTKGQIVQSLTAAARIAEILLEQIFQWAGPGLALLQGLQGPVLPIPVTLQHECKVAALI